MKMSLKKKIIRRLDFQYGVCYPKIYVRYLREYYKIGDEDFN